MVHQQKQYKFYDQNLSSLFQYLCITLVIKKLYEFEISTLDDLLILFIKLNTNFLLKGGKFKTSQIRNSNIKMHRYFKLMLSNKFFPHFNYDNMTLHFKYDR